MNEICTYLNSHSMRDNQIKVNLQTFANIDQIHFLVFNRKFQLLTKLTEKCCIFHMGKSDLFSFHFHLSSSKEDLEH